MPTLPPPPVDLERLAGRWAIVATTLPFWEGKLAPTVTYAPHADDRRAWDDTLAWRAASGKVRTLRGVDRRQPGLDGLWTWRGRGLLCMLTSQWRFVAADPQGAWAVTWFARATLGVTPEGMDVYARDPGFAREATERIVNAVRQDPRWAHLRGWRVTEGQELGV